MVNEAYERPIELARYLNGAVVAETRAYDRLGRLTGVVDPGGSAWSYTYDLRGLRRTATDPDRPLALFLRQFRPADAANRRAPVRHVADL